MTMFTGEKRFPGRSVLAALALLGLLAFAATPRAFAREDPYYKCQRRIAKADYKLHAVIERHGPYSRQAEHQRHELREARERCWNQHHRWWDEDGHRWHNDHDWDDRDHDRYRP